MFSVQYCIQASTSFMVGCSGSSVHCSSRHRPKMTCISEIISILIQNRVLHENYSGNELLFINKNAISEHSTLGTLAHRHFKNFYWREYNLTVVAIILGSNNFREGRAVFHPFTLKVFASWSWTEYLLANCSVQSWTRRIVDREAESSHFLLSSRTCFACAWDEACFPLM